MTFGGTDGIAIDTTGADVGSPAAFDGIVQADHHRRFFGQEGVEEQEQQPLRHGMGRPDSAIEQAMELAEIGILLLSENAQGGGNGTSARRQNDPCQQGQDVGPTWLGEQTGKAGEPIHKMSWQRRREGGETIKMLHALDKNDLVF